MATIFLDILPAALRRSSRTGYTTVGRTFYESKGARTDSCQLHIDNTQK